MGGVGGNSSLDEFSVLVSAISSDLFSSILPPNGGGGVKTSLGGVKLGGDEGKLPEGNTASKSLVEEIPEGFVLGKFGDFLKGG